MGRYCTGRRNNHPYPTQPMAQPAQRLDLQVHSSNLAPVSTSGPGLREPAMAPPVGNALPKAPSELDRHDGRNGHQRDRRRAHHDDAGLTGEQEHGRVCRLGGTSSHGGACVAGMRSTVRGSRRTSRSTKDALERAGGRSLARYGQPDRPRSLSPRCRTPRTPCHRRGPVGREPLPEVAVVLTTVEGPDRLITLVVGQSRQVTLGRQSSIGRHP